MNVSISGLKNAVRKAFRDHGKTVDEDRLKSMVQFLGLVSLDALPKHRAGGLGMERLADLNDKQETVEKLMASVKGQAGETASDDFSWSRKAANA